MTNVEREANVLTIREQHRGKDLALSGRLLIAVPSTGRQTARACLVSLRSECRRAEYWGVDAEVAVFLNNVLETSDIECSVRDVLAQHVEAQGIADVRNRILDFARENLFDYVIFFDDDQVPCGGWLQAFVHAAMSSSSDVLLGPVVGVVPRSAPRWARANPHLFRATASQTEGEPYRGHAYSGNTLIRISSPSVAGLRFSADFNEGGEDTYYFFQLRQRGASICWVGGARCIELQGPDRTTLAGLARRRFQKGRVARRLERSGVFRSSYPTALRHGYRVARATFLLLASSSRSLLVTRLLEAGCEVLFVLGVFVEELSYRRHLRR